MENIVTDNFFDRILDILKNARKQAKMALNILWSIPTTK